MAAPRLSGAFAPAVTPFTPGLDVDFDAYAAHCLWLQRHGAGLAIFGTNSEANSLSLAERMMLLDRLSGRGIDFSRTLPGTGGCALPDTVALSRHALLHGCAGVLVLPPFFYKGVSDDGLFAYYSELIERVADANLRLFLYHIPAFSGVPISLGLIERLARRYPDQIAGVKDSNGDWANIEAMLRNFPHLAIFPASESFLTRAMPLGAAGCISATINVNPAAISALCANWAAPGAAAAQQQVDRIRRIFQKYPMIAALKWAIGHARGQQQWQVQRPPLSPLSAQQQASLLAELAAAGFAMAALEQP
ncbi:dihydrodipicolinate synthetase [Massilia sp. Root418]|uniref:dihydrodipicolinate synthase family protein n=1 Tax=Massilia sp. Root418 TaxID=1736532 RepID=UPI000700ADF9|nr:dihydrodipicolinate synthase family protein [Massilia sp. Root418]KQX01793.1 dihydrodipicolinate synthetase [Massilia sp. Root418]